MKVSRWFLDSAVSHLVVSSQQMLNLIIKLEMCREASHASKQVYDLRVTADLFDNAGTTASLSEWNLTCVPFKHSRDRAATITTGTSSFAAMFVAS